jgi:16S rRNA (guanine527-N7)-methyltransferase
LYDEPMGQALVRPEGGWPLARAASELGVALTDAATTALGQWLDLLATWNARVDLTAARSPSELVDLMLVDALVLSARIPAGARVVDVGTGAGAPGLALAVLRSDLEMTLVEPLAKRGAFLRTVLGTLGLTRVKLEARRGEAVASSHPEAWDVALARATLPPEEWLALAERLVKPRASAWVFVVKESDRVSPGFAVAEEVAYRWPLTGAERRLVRYERLEGA